MPVVAKPLLTSPGVSMPCSLRLSFTIVADFCLMDLARTKHHLSKQCDIADRAAEAVHGN